MQVVADAEAGRKGAQKALPYAIALAAALDAESPFIRPDSLAVRSHSNLLHNDQQWQAAQLMQGDLHLICMANKQVFNLSVRAAVVALRTYIPSLSIEWLHLLETCKQLRMLLLVMVPVTGPCVLFPLVWWIHLQLMNL